MRIFLALMLLLPAPAFAEDSVFLDGQTGALKPEFRKCVTDDDCSFTDVIACVDHIAVNVASKGLVSGKIKDSNAAASCIVPPKNMPPAYPVHCTNNLCDWSTSAAQ